MKISSAPSAQPARGIASCPRSDDLKAALRQGANRHGQPFQLNGIERTKVYQAGISWEEPWFQLDAFYRTGHYHWGYEGDFFGLYREAYYGENVDIYNGEAPVGVELRGKRAFDGLKLAFGPEIHWGANPMVLLKYPRRLGTVDATAMYQDEFARQSTVTTSIAVPLPPTRRATLALATTRGPFGLEAGGIWAGSTKVDETFQVVEGTTSDPGAAGTQSTNEISYTGPYARVSVARSGTGWTVSSTNVSNAAAATFAECTGGSASATHFGIGTDSSGAGHLVLRGALSATLNISTGITPSFAIGQLDVDAVTTL